VAELNQEIYRVVLESLPTGVYLVDRNRRILFWNEGAEEITGYLRQEVIGRHCHDNLLMHCDENNDLLCGLACPLQQTMHDGQPREADVFLRHKDGQRVPVRVRSVPIRSEDGQITGAAECFDEREVLAPADANLTDLPDRTATLARLAAALGEFEATQAPFGVLSIVIDDLDHLRHADGRNAVRAVLNVTARTLSRNLGTHDMLGRWSEERFVAIIANCSATTLLKSAGLWKRLVSLEGVSWWGDRLSVTLSMGGTIARAGDTPESLVSRAEEALQRSLLEHGDYAVVV
jgi:PAS domain S-box-containing protein/diguanylate cyclase (GGDEF)-like protein